jgi:hypothetical protein
VKKKDEKKLISEAMSLLAKKNAGKKRNVDPEIAKERGRKGAEKRWGKKGKNS